MMVPYSTWHACLASGVLARWIVVPFPVRRVYVTAVLHLFLDMIRSAVGPYIDLPYL